MNQPTLFDMTPDPWEVDDAEYIAVARVVFSQGASGVYDYRIPDALREDVGPGKRVRVPFGRGNRGIVAYCVDVTQGATHRGELKSLESVLDPRPILSPAMLRLTEWMSEYYLCPWGRVLEGVVPAGVRKGAGTREVVLMQLAPHWRQAVNENKLTEKQTDVLRAAERAGPLTAKQLAHAAGCTTAPVQSLRKKGLLVASRKRVQTDWEASEPLARDTPPVLNAEQREALDAIETGLRSDDPSVYLLHGVTGSGKTEVYMRVIEQVVAAGRQAIVLVPEISLTPQTCRRFRARFSRIAVLHSHLSDAERHWHWQQIAAGAVQVIVGARSAVFAPTPRLGVIVIDEEHDGSFKQDTVPRYHARDVALRRAREESIPVVLGSATPDLQSWHRAQQGEYQVLRIATRIRSLPLPPVDLVDLRTQQFERTHRGAISRPLEQGMREALRDGGQVILLLNRRGYSTHIQCPACGEVIRCADCDIALTHHRDLNRAICHYCDHEQPAPAACPQCRFDGIRYGGLGTQRLEQEVRSRFPEHRSLRVDSDTMQRPGSHEEAFAMFREGQVRILLGTQMIAKGLDFPNVTLVGVINADTALHLPDFRAAERTFQLITQVAGRTGRGDRGGRVIVQSYQPDHAAVIAAAQHDFQRFADGELPQRKEFGYPPYGSMVRIIVRGPDETATQAFADTWVASIRQRADDVGCSARLLGPAPAPIAKLRGRFRFHALIQFGPTAAIRDVLRATIDELRPPADLQWVVDVDPHDML